MDGDCWVHWTDVSLSRCFTNFYITEEPKLILPGREALCEDESFPERQLASLLAAKVYYHLQEYNESMVFALGAGKLFNIEEGGEFEETIICKNKCGSARKCAD